MQQKLWKGAAALALGAAVAGWSWIFARDAAGDHGSCRHNCRCSRLQYFDRLLPPMTPGRGGDALGSVQRTIGLLLADPATDWSEVNVARLRRHLVDLNEIMMSAGAEERPVESGVEVTLGGAEGTLDALRRVVPEHVLRMNGFRGWRLKLEDTGDSLILSIHAEDDEAEVVRGLGFFGFLASGVHRPQHDLAIVQGRSVL